VRKGFGGKRKLSDKTKREVAIPFEAKNPRQKGTKPRVPVTSTKAEGAERGRSRAEEGIMKSKKLCLKEKSFGRTSGESQEKKGSRRHERLRGCQREGEERARVTYRATVGVWMARGNLHRKEKRLQRLLWRIRRIEGLQGGLAPKLLREPPNRRRRRHERKQAQSRGRRKMGGAISLGEYQTHDIVHKPHPLQKPTWGPPSMGGGRGYWRYTDRVTCKSGEDVG